MFGGEKMEDKIHKYLFNFFDQNQEIYGPVYYRIYSLGYDKKTVGDFDGVFSSEKSLESLMKGEEFLDVDLKDISELRRNCKGSFMYFKEDK